MLWFVCWVVFSPEQIIMLFLYRKDTGVFGHVLFKPQKLFHFLLRFSRSKPSIHFNVRLFKITLNTSKQPLLSASINPAYIQYDIS